MESKFDRCVVVNNTLLFFILLLTSIPSLTAAKADEDLGYLFKMSLEELLKVQVTGSTLTPKELRMVPSSVTVFSHKEIRNLGLDTLDELMNMVPGFQSYRSSTTPLHNPYSSRGRRIGSPAAEILIMVDGIRLAEPRNSGSALVVPKYPLIQIERVEFIRGPGSAVYGSNAMMGVINVTTRSGVDEVNIGYGSFTRRKAHLLTTQQLGDVTVDLLAGIDMDEGDDYRVLDTFSSKRIATNDPRDIASVDIKLHRKDTRLNLQYYGYKAKNFYELSGISNGFNERSGRLTTISIKQALDWQTVSSSVWVSYSRSRVATSAQLTAPDALAVNSSPSSNDALFASAAWDNYSETRLLWHNDWTTKLQSSLQFGVELRHIDAPETIAQNNFDMGDLANGTIPIRYYGSLLASTPVQAASKRDITGLYGQYQHQLFDNTQLTLGLRYDDFTTIGSHLSPRFGWVQALNDHHSLKLLYGEAFRAPSESELNLVNNPVYLGNTELEPETVQTSELIWMGQWSDTGLSLGYFESRYKNAITVVDRDEYRISENVGQGPSKGFELEFIHQLNEHWMLRSSYTDFIELPALSFREADQLASLMVNYQLENWNANLVAAYHSDRDMPALDSNGKRITVTDYWLLFGKLQYTFNYQWRATIQMKNLTDKDYLAPPTSSTIIEGIPNRGYEILAGFIWQF